MNKCPLGEAHPEQIDMELTPEEITQAIIDIAGELGRVITRADEEQAISRATVAKVLRIQADRHPSREAVANILTEKMEWERDDTKCPFNKEKKGDCYEENGDKCVSCSCCWADAILSLIQPELTGISDEKILEAFDGDFGEVYFDHQPTQEEILLIKLRLVAQAQLAHDKEGGKR